jgi:sugar phosphate isomerase/epimerase
MAPYAKHTHLKNIAYPVELRETTREGGWEYGKYVSSLEEGDINHARVIKILARAGYKGDICVEDESLGHHDTAEARIALLKRDVEYVKRLVADA